MSVQTVNVTRDFQSDSLNEKTILTPSTISASLSDSAATSASDSDAGYSTPAENFADDEEHRDDGAVSVKPVPSPEADSATNTTTEKNAVEIVVDPELRDRIVKQVEWYFSDENLLKDSFLMKHINRNKQGYVSLKLVASLRKVKVLTKDWQAVLVSMAHSSSLALNEEGTKIRRIAPAPKVDYSHVSRTVIITNYSEPEPTVHDIEKQFGRFGDVTLVRMLHPGRAIPLDVKPCKERFPSLGKELCILVEYESEEGAKVAFQKFNDQQNWRDEVKVSLLGEKKPTTTHDAAKEDKKHDTKSTAEPSQVAVGPADGKKKRKKNNQKSQQQNQNQHQQVQPKGKHIREKSPGRLSNSNTPSPWQSRDSSPAPYRKYTPPSSTTSPDVHRKRSAGARYSPEMHRRTHLHPDAWKDYTSDSGFSTGSRSASESPKNTPEPLKRFFSGDVAPSWRTSEKHVHVKDSYVIRQPHGPDGTKGFHRRPVRISVESC